MADLKLEINVFSHTEEWITATVEDADGNEFARVTAPVVEGATFDTRSAVVRAAIEDALFELKAEEDR